jgi:hypothetical protein
VRGAGSVGIASVEGGQNEAVERPEGTDAAAANTDFEFEHAADIDGTGSGSVVRMESVAAAGMDYAP